MRSLHVSKKRRNVGFSGPMTVYTLSKTSLKIVISDGPRLNFIPTKLKESPKKILGQLRAY